ncbi:sugar phosphate isomerase/epimerase family protein [Sphingobacterium lumbrici]|uniref:sugar phosphate isomerase/epimerase family protein n=1 Tax=Sphingobacterium lumbrici TaxID=2559600 RepID=UPI0011281C60|nr:sugar phosphate isomerase/epimerase [Sphingobacterium lumbrici]
MNIQFYYPRWGSENISWDTFCQNVKEAGYDGVEAPLPEDTKERELILRVLEDSGLQLIGQYYQSFEKDFEEHKANYTRLLYLLASAQPVKINAQTGKDYFSFDQNAELFAIADAITRETGIAIGHETHRNKALFAAHIAYNFLKKLPELKITADFSHWCNVAESLLEDQEEAMAAACEKVEHIHSRVGHTQGAQVIDPRLPAFKNELEAHIKWWDAIVKVYEDQKREVLTITTEFGPAPYMVHLPFTNMPVASQWDINLYMKHLLKERYCK